jgi:hypothetical protein
LDEHIRINERVYYRVWSGLVQGLGTVIQALKKPIAGIGSCITIIGEAYYKDWEL